MEKEAEIPFDYADATDVGRVRELNEDNILSRTGLWLVADGMGGHACGEVASEMAIQRVFSCLTEHMPINQAIQNAHQEIVVAGKQDTARLGMGTTIVVMVADQVKFDIAWVGDSRAYLWDARTAKLTQLTEDHSLMVRLINAGLITADDALTHPQRHMITQCLGSTEIEQVKVDSIEKEWESGQQVLLCSDGLTDEVPDRLIAEIMSSKMSLKEKTDTLVKTAKQAGGRDNISVILVDSPIKKAPGLLQKILSLFGKS